MRETVTRSYDYEPVRFALNDLKERDGLTFLREILAGTRPGPSIAPTLGFALHGVEPGKVVFRGEPGGHAMNPIGTMHGGFAGAMLDSCMACSVQSRLSKGFAYTTTEFSINLVRAILPDTGPLLAIGETLHVGRKLGTAEGRLVGEVDGKLYAHGTTTCLVMPLNV